MLPLLPALFWEKISFANALPTPALWSLGIKQQHVGESFFFCDELAACNPGFQLYYCSSNFFPPTEGDDMFSNFEFWIESLAFGQRLPS